ncbi:OmpA family protein [Flavobacterium sp. ACAM 123]|uniref:OmpA family protein n=1 Tax=Flavobacterium sp. ACAM 123 TaxID=1189620 RepID=UPI0002F0C964|nr:OmpA family protein [Flavobacterium sp. ACAM 123]
MNEILAKKKIATVEELFNAELKGEKYNRWSLNLNGGFNAPVGPFTTGYFSATADYLTDPNFNHLDFNVRKMFNTKFGLMLGLSYDKFSSSGASSPFSNSMYGTSIQGVLNVHRALNWEEFTKNFGLQFHLGPGLTFLESQEIRPVNSKYVDKGLVFDNIYSIISGATVLIKLSDRFAFNLDYSMMKNFSHHLNLDGRTKVDLASNRTGIIHTATAGVTVYLGKKGDHADWYLQKNGYKLDDFLARVNKVEAQLNDANYDGIPDGLEMYVKGRFYNSQINNNAYSSEQNLTNVESRNMINSNLINVFFDFDQSRISSWAISDVSFLIKYLNANPETSVDIIGYGDELDDSENSLRLSKNRADNVSQMIIGLGIDASRLKVIKHIGDNSVPKESKLAKQLVRRVVFKVY